MLLHYRYGSYYGASVAHILYEIADQLAKSSNDHLWCAILGVTYQHLLELVPEDAYGRDFEALRDACLRENPTSTIGASGARLSSAIDQLDYNRDGQIKQEDEFRFMLMRHWTLFNAMFHSRYVATRLGVWRERGRRLLETFIVKMGIPLHQCTRDYASMEQDFKDSLPKRLARHAADFGIREAVFSSFSRNYGYVLRLSASDAVYALMALVEAPHPEDLPIGEDPYAGKERVWVRNFYSAFDALDLYTPLCSIPPL
jgi:cell division control protein 45